MSVLYNRIEAARRAIFPHFSWGHRVDDNLCRRVDEHAVLVVSGQTSSGKTYTLPPFIALWASVRKGGMDDVLIAVCLPKRVLAEEAAGKLTSDLQSAGKHVGWVHGEGDNRSDNVRILFCTAGWMTAKANDEEFMDKVTAFVLDEVHERSNDLDCLLSVLRRRLHTRANDPAVMRQRVLLMSATAETALWRQYFGTHTATGFEPLDDDCFHDIVVPPGVQTFHKVEHYVQRPVEYLHLAAAQRVALAIIHRSGDILVFVSGADDMRAVVMEIRSVLTKYPPNQSVEVFTLAATHSEEEQQRVLRYSGRKVIVATNVAESGITLPGVATVIDTGLYKQSWYDEDTGIYSLERCWIPKSSAVQRAGRTGRTCNGEVFRMFPPAIFETAPEQAPSAIVTDDCTNVVLRLALLLGNTYDCLELPQPPSQKRHDSALKRLIAVGVADEYGYIRYDHPLVDVKVMFSLGLDFRLACMLMGGLKYGCLNVMIDVVALLHVDGIYERDSSMRELTRSTDRAYWSNQGNPFRLLNLFREATVAERAGNLARWRDQTGISAAALAAVREKRAELRKANLGRTFVFDLDDRKAEAHVFDSDEPGAEVHDFDGPVKAFIWGTWDNLAVQMRPGLAFFESASEDGRRLEFRIPEWEAVHRSCAQADQLLVVATTREEKEGHEYPNVVPIEHEEYEQVMADMWEVRRPREMGWPT